jgi:predicted DNA repair protein MutK
MPLQSKLRNEPLTPLLLMGGCRSIFFAVEFVCHLFYPEGKAVMKIRSIASINPSALSYTTFNDIY